MANFFDRYIDKRMAEIAAPPEVEPQQIRDGRYGLRRMENFTPAWQQRPMPSVEAAREEIFRMMEEYIRDPAPNHILLFPMAAGVGKTWAAVNFAHWLQERLIGQRIFFAGQRHDAIDDIRVASAAQGKEPNMWLEWQPRKTLADQSNPLSTCLYEREINEYMRRGYKGNSFCQKICGFDYMENGCVYHAQKKKPEPIIFGQHAHVFLGHPLMSKSRVLIGDENPMSSIPRTWLIPSGKLYTESMDWDEPMTALFYELRGLLQDETADLSGPELLDYLGSRVRSEIDGDKSNAQVINEMCNNFIIPADQILEPNIRRANDALDVDYNFLPDLVPLLERESEWAMQGKPYIKRIRAYRGNLELPLRNYVNEKVPRHIIWFDATGEERFYREMFRREVRVVDAVPAFRGRIWQVHDRLNGKGALIRDGESIPTPEFTNMVEEGKVSEVVDEEIITTRQVEDAAVIFEVLAKRHESLSVISFKSLTGKLSEAYEFMHFYANRGSNKFEGTDALVVFGTPMPSIPAMEELAKAIYFNDMEPFDSRWVSVERAYRFQDSDGVYLGNTVREFMDPRLNVILWQSREAELIQSVHRARPIVRDCDVYLMSSLPIDQIQPTNLVSMYELLGDGVPDGVSPVMWAKIQLALEDLSEENGAVTASELSERTGISMSTSYRIFYNLMASSKWEAAVVPAKGTRGRRSARAIVRKESDV